MFTWTEDLINEAFRLVAEGYTTVQIAKRFGITKNAVIGKLNRERVARGIKPPRKSESDEAIRLRKRLTKKKPTERKRRNRMLTLADRAESVSRYVSPRPDKPDEGVLASIVDVTGCRYPVRDDPAFIGGHAYCNHPQDGGSSYCAYHHRVCSHVVPMNPKLATPVGLRFGKAAA